MNFHTRRQKKGTSSKVVRSYFLDENGRETTPSSSDHGEYHRTTTSHSLEPDTEEIGMLYVRVL